jgi:hypothetical protein
LRSADFQVCRIAGFQTGRSHDIEPPADLEIGDTAGLETMWFGNLRYEGGNGPR